MVLPYPTMGEINKRVAGAYFSPRLFESPVHPVVGWLWFSDLFLKGSGHSSMFQTLSGRFFIVTVLFVVLAEILILVPSVARFSTRLFACKPGARANRILGA